MNLPFIQFLFKILFVIGFSLFFITCKDDSSAAREEAQKNAMSNTAEKQVEEPAEPQNNVARPPTSGEITLNAAGGEVSQGEEICIPVKAQDFKGIMSMQYTMKWDPKVLEFTNVKSFGLPGLSGNNFGGVQAKEGLLAYSWFDQNVQGLTYNNGHLLYEVCFKAVGEPGSQTRFQFADKPVIIEITNSASLFLDLKGQPAVVKVK